MMRSQLPTRFLRIGSRLINVEAIAEVKLNKDSSAVMLLQVPGKSLERMPIPQPAGREVWEFVMQNLVVAEFGEPPAVLRQAKGNGAAPEPAAKPSGKKRAKAK